MRIFRKEETEIIYYILGKDINDKWLSKGELEFVKDMDFTDKSLPDTAKQIWDNRNNPKVLKTFAKIANKENKNEIAKTIDKLIEGKEDKYMNNKMMIFKNDNFGEIRSLEIDGEPYFVGKDIADILGYNNPQKAIRDHVDEEDKTVNDLFIVNGTKGILINESGLYSLIMSSKLPKAKLFKRWVTSEVLPSIRKNGSYELDTNGLMKQLVDSQASLNYVLAGFKMQIDNDFKETNNKLTEHDELLKKRVYISPLEAKKIQDAVKEKAKEIAIDNNLQYHTVKLKIFARLYDKLKDRFNVATYRELPSIYYEDILKTIKKLSIYILDLKDEQISL